MRNRPIAYLECASALTLACPAVLALLALVMAQFGLTLETTRRHLLPRFPHGIIPTWDETRTPPCSEIHF